MHTEGHSCCCHKLPILISGILLILVAIFDIVRLVMGWSITINGEEIPLWTSVVCAIVFGGVAVWNFLSACCKKCHNDNHHHDHDHNHNHNVRREPPPPVK